MKKTALACLILAGTQAVAFEGAHVHGSGQLFIAQQGNQWQVQFSVPAGDIFGFEHAPESNEQKDEVKKQLAYLQQDNALIAVPNSCKMSSRNLSTPAYFAESLGVHEHSDEHDHDEHHDHDDEHDHDEHHDHEHEHEHHEHDHDEHHDHDDEHDESSHQNVELTYMLECSELTQLTFTVFNQFSSIEKLDVVWTTESSQGTGVATADNASVTISD